MRNFAPKIVKQKKQFKLTAPEYIQLKAFARIDGAMLSVLMMAGFVCHVMSLTSPIYEYLASAMIVMTPFFVGSRLKRFRDYGREGVISFMRGWAYVSMMFFYGGLLFALMHYGYMTYIDKGHLASTVTQVMSIPEIAETARQMGMADDLNEMVRMLQIMRPIDFSLNMLTIMVTAGILLGMPIAAIMKKVKK